MENSFKQFTDFYTAFHFLHKHALFDGDYNACLYMEVVKVSPITKCIEDDRRQNTETNVWFEAGPPGCHDVDLDSGGASYEEATIMLANRVYQKYGDEQAEPKAKVCCLIM